MKKFILTVALVLAVVTSLVAGTMAAYTQQIDTSSGELSTKKFNIVSTSRKSKEVMSFALEGATVTVTV